MKMTKQETGFFSSFDGLKLFYRAWERASDSCLIIVHGMGEHSGRYQEFVEQLDDLNISVYAYDSRGHGYSDGKSVYIDSFDDFVKDLYGFRSFIETRRKSPCKFILFGQSLGGLIATDAVLKDASAWQALILSSPFFGLCSGHRPLVLLATAINFCLPKFIWSNPIKPFFLSHDPDEIQKYKSDSLIQRRITARMAHEMFRACNRVYGKAKDISLPVFILASGNDKIVSLKAVESFYRNISSQQKRIEVFPNCYHELLHEKERNEVVQMIKEYLIHLRGSVAGLH